MLTKPQIKLLQTALRAAGLRRKGLEGQYRLLLAQYKQPDGSKVTSCKQLNYSQLEDLLAICESYGWVCPNKTRNYYRCRVDGQYDVASFAQQAAILKLQGDLGWNKSQLEGFLKRMTEARTGSVAELSPAEAHSVIEALKNMFSRQTGKNYKSLAEIKNDMEVENGKTAQVG